MTSPLLNVQTERLINDSANRWKFQKGPEKKRKLPNLAKKTKLFLFFSYEGFPKSGKQKQIL